MSRVIAENKPPLYGAPKLCENMARTPYNIFAGKHREIAAADRHAANAHRDQNASNTVRDCRQMPPRPLAHRSGNAEIWRISHHRRSLIRRVRWLTISVADTKTRNALPHKRPTMIPKRGHAPYLLSHNRREIPCSASCTLLITMACCQSSKMTGVFSRTIVNQKSVNIK